MDSSCGSLRYLRGNRGVRGGASAHEREAAHVHVSLPALCATRKSDNGEYLHESAGLEGGVVRCRDAAGAARRDGRHLSPGAAGWLGTRRSCDARLAAETCGRLGCRHAAVDEHAPAVRREDAVHHRVVLRRRVRPLLNDEHTRGGPAPPPFVCLAMKHRARESAEAMAGRVVATSGLEPSQLFSNDQSQSRSRPSRRRRHGSPRPGTPLRSCRRVRRRARSGSAGARAGARGRT